MRKSLCLSMAASLSLTRRRFSSSQSPFQKALDRHFLKLQKHLLPTTIALENPFSVPANRDPVRPTVFPHSGVLVDPTTIVTSAHLVGRVAAAADGSGVYRSQIGTTVALSNPDGRALKTETLAVSFAHDVAVLKLAAPREQIPASFRHCSMAKSPPKKDDILVAVQEMEFSQFQMLGNVRAAVGGRTFGVKPPWPSDNDSKWMEFDFHTRGQVGGGVRRSSYLFNSEHEITGSMSIFSGSPLFNIDGELIGVTSWEVRDGEKGPPFLVLFAAPLSPIMAAIEYAKTKKPDDPIVMDTWISNGVNDDL